MISLEQIKSAAVPILGVVGGAAVTFGIMSASQVGAAQVDVNLIWDGVTKIAAGIGGLIGIAAPIIAAYRSSKGALAARVQASPTEQVITKDPAVAAAHPEIQLKK